MTFLGYIFSYCFIWLLHLLPERLLYLISDFLYLLLRYVVRYRKKVVFDNLQKAFPEYSRSEILDVVRKFYHHLCDLILESSVSHFYSEARALKRITYRNPELLNEIYSSGKQVMAVTGHYGNWEYLSTLGMASNYPVVAIYKPLKNKYFDDRFGIQLAKENDLHNLVIAIEVRNLAVHNRSIINQRYVNRLKISYEKIGTKRIIDHDELLELSSLLFRCVKSLDEEVKTKFGLKGIRFRMNDN